MKMKTVIVSDDLSTVYYSFTALDMLRANMWFGTPESEESIQDCSMEEYIRRAEADKKRRTLGKMPLPDTKNGKPLKYSRYK